MSLGRWSALLGVVGFVVGVAILPLGFLAAIWWECDALPALLAGSDRVCTGEPRERA